MTEVRRVAPIDNLDYRVLNYRIWKSPQFWPMTEDRTKVRHKLANGLLVTLLPYAAMITGTGLLTGVLKYPS